MAVAPRCFALEKRCVRPPLRFGTWAGARVFFLVALALAGLPSHGFGQQPLVGVVTDRETSAPLPGVYVALESQVAEEILGAVLTDPWGRFVLSAETGGTYRLRAERVGLATERTEWFTLEGAAPLWQISMREQAVELEGMSVSVPVRTCRVDPREATIVQRWWDEVRKALEATVLAEEGELTRLRFERFERSWAPNLRALRDERLWPVDSSDVRPFRSQDAAILSERGYVQGVEGERRFLAPDAEVLFSGAFLTDHCFQIADEEDAQGDEEENVEAGHVGELRLAVGPTRRRPSDIQGELTVDTLSGELRSFDFEYVNLPEDIPRSEAGGHLSFEYLPSGAWIVSEWWIRMPQLRYVAGGPLTIRGSAPLVVGYVDQGGRVVEADGRPLERQAGVEMVHGTVYDSLAGRPLAGAAVSIVGSRLSTRTGPDGRFTLRNVPSGRRSLTFHHAELGRLGLPSPVLSVDIDTDPSDSVGLAIPGFATLAHLYCQDHAVTPDAILTGSALDVVGGDPPSSAVVRATWIESADASGPRRSMWTEAIPGTDGRYVFCDLPSDVPVALAVRTDSTSFRDAGEVELPGHGITVRELQPGEAARAVVRGTVRAADGGRPFAGADVKLFIVNGDTVAGTRTDTAGAFHLSVPAGVGYRLVASADEHLREASAVFTVGVAEYVDADFELLRDPAVLALKIEGILVEIEARDREVARRLLRQYGQSAASLGRRWIARQALDSLPSTGESDPGVAIQNRGVPGVWVDQAAKRGANPILCVQQRGDRGCAIVIFNGMKIDLSTALLIDFRDLEGIAVLSAQEATNLFGTGSHAGAVLLWTRGSGR